MHDSQGMSHADVPSLAGGGMRESQHGDEWQGRVEAQIRAVGEYGADVIGLQVRQRRANVDVVFRTPARAVQEFWSSSERFVSMWRAFADEQGYHMVISPRTNSKQECSKSRRGGARHGRGDMCSHHSTSDLSRLTMPSPRRVRL